MTTRIYLKDKQGKEHRVLLDIQKGTLRWEDTGNLVSLDPVRLQYAMPSMPWEHAAERVTSPEQPGHKRGVKTLVKVQLGLNCNFNCAYCLQEPETPMPGGKAKRVIPIAGPTARKDDVQRFLENLPNWLQAGEQLRFELWGGEPFVYWKTFKPLAEGLMRQYPQASVGTVSNGSLITDEIVDWFLSHPQLGITISHDGPAGHRDEDVLDNPAVVRLYHGLRAQGRLMGFNCVMTAGNLSVVAIRAYIASKLGVPAEEVRLSTEGLVTPYDEPSRRFVPTHEEMAIVFKELVTRKSLFLFGPDLGEYMQGFAMQKPATAVGQRCGLDRPESIVVSLKTQDVVTCQNTLPVGKHRLGHVDDLDNVKLDTVWHWKARPHCGECPVLPLCKGSCLYLEEDEFARACDSQFKYRLPFLAAALYFITGFVMTKVDWAGGTVEVDYLQALQRQ